MKDIINIWVQNKPGVLGKISSICRRRRFNIEAITAGQTHIKDLTLVTLVVKGSRVDQVINQINKLIEVVKIEKVDPDKVNTRELLLIRKKTRRNDRELLDYIEKNGYCKVLEKNKNETVLEVTTNHISANKIAAKVNSKDIRELVRTGLTTIKKIK